ncbi:hypothetical protein VM1G_10755 [Cytospora mali]|uniref:Uncharacterized protein n=1 Tax=Cytospora mali TaxID=578113 RepID=A0A194VJ24_CYTMA|nr:hypothetical protein VM1G_10755 [Valsa mali]
MPQKYTIHPESLIAPSQVSPYLTIFFRRGVESRDAIFSFEQPDGHKEVFTERVTARDVRSNESGLCTVNLPKGEVPTFPIRRDLEDRVGDVLVKLHAWKGERHLGVWEVGRLSGKHVYTVVD